MQVNKALLPVLALSPLASGQGISAPTSAPGLVTIDVIETLTTSFAGEQASLGNVTLYVPVPTVVPANMTSGLLRFANTTQTQASLPTRPVAIPAGNTTYFPSVVPLPLPTSTAGAGRVASDSMFAAAAALVGMTVLLG